MADPIYKLLIGNLWQVKESQLTQLRDKFTLPASKLSSLRTELKQPSNMMAEKIPAIDKEIARVPIIQTQLKPITENKPIDHAQSENISSDKKPIIEKISINTSDANQPNFFNNWEDLTNRAVKCTDCTLCKSRTQVVIERGNRESHWMFIGEGPGEQEDLQGKSFVGPSGQLLDKMIGAMGLDSNKDVYITNVIKCRPPHNRNPEPEEIAACSKYLLSQIELVRPKIIITLGRFAAQSILNTETAVGKLRGVTHYFKGIPVVVTYHPSYLLRTATAKKDAWTDLQMAMKIFNDTIIK